VKKKANSFRTWMIWQLRRLSYRWPPRQAALRGAQRVVTAALKKEYPRCRNFYQCAVCGEVFSRKEVSVDHIDPVIDPKRGWQGFEVYIKRLFCGAQGFQIICSDCHDAKTAHERKIRMKYKKAA